MNQANTNPDMGGIEVFAPSAESETYVSTMEMQHHHSGGFWRRLVGWTCLGIGLLGIVLPIIPGIPFLVAGMVSLSTEHRWMRAALVWAKRKLGKFWPRISRMLRLPHRRSRVPGPQAKPSS